LRAVERLVSKVLHDLLQGVLPTYREAVGECATPARWDRQRWGAVDPASHPHTARLRDALLAWGTPYHLIDDWLLDVALRTVCERHEWEHESAERRAAGLSLTLEPAAFATIPFADIEPVTPFNFEHEQWVPWWETRADYERALHVAFKRSLRAYLDQREGEARKRGFRLSPQKHALDHHLDWLVRWQVLGRSWPDLMTETPHRASRDTIREAIERLASEIGLTLRRGKAGRPRTTPP
jgi:hypothetical protein